MPLKYSEKQNCSEKNSAMHETYKIEHMSNTKYVVFIHWNDNNAVVKLNQSGAGIRLKGEKMMKFFGNGSAVKSFFSSVNLSSRRIIVIGTFVDVLIFVYDNITQRLDDLILSAEFVLGKSSCCRILRVKNSVWRLWMGR